MNLNDRFSGIFARDKLTTDITNSNPGFYVLNLDHSTSNGTHWVCFYYSSKNIEYFDSYGLKPTAIISENYSLLRKRRLTHMQPTIMDKIYPDCLLKILTLVFPLPPTYQCCSFVRF